MHDFDGDADPEDHDHDHDREWPHANWRPMSCTWFMTESSPTTRTATTSGAQPPFAPPFVPTTATDAAAIATMPTIAVVQMVTAPF